MPVPIALTVASSDSGGGAGIQADLKAFAAAGCHGASVLVALTAQNTRSVTAIHELPPEFVVAQLEAVFDDLDVAAAKTGMLFSTRVIETVAAFLESHPLPVVVDPVMIASSGGKLLEDDAIDAYVERLFPLATAVTPNLPEAVALADASPVATSEEPRRNLGGTSEEPPGRRELAERIHELGAPAVIVTGGHGADPIDHLFDGRRHVEIPVDRVERPTTHGAGCTHSATLAAHLARGASLEEAARAAAEAASGAVRRGLEGIGAGEGPVDVVGLEGAK